MGTETILMLTSVNILVFLCTIWYIMDYSSIKMSRTSEMILLWYKNSTFRLKWYLLLLISSSVYVYFHWRTITATNFFDSITGQSLMFFIWIFLVLSPFVKNLDILGVKIDIDLEKQEAVNIAVEKALNTSDSEGMTRKLHEYQMEVMERGGKS